MKPQAGRRQSARPSFVPAFSPAARSHLCPLILSISFGFYLLFPCIESGRIVWERAFIFRGKIETKVKPLRFDFLCRRERDSERFISISHTAERPVCLPACLSVRPSQTSCKPGHAALASGLVSCSHATAPLISVACLRSAARGHAGRRLASRRSSVMERKGPWISHGAYPPPVFLLFRSLNPFRDARAVSQKRRQ